MHTWWMDSAADQRELSCTTAIERGTGFIGMPQPLPCGTSFSFGAPPCPLSSAWAFFVFSAFAFSSAAAAAVISGGMEALPHARRGERASRGRVERRARARALEAGLARVRPNTLRVPGFVVDRRAGDLLGHADARARDVRDRRGERGDGSEERGEREGTEHSADGGGKLQRIQGRDVPWWGRAGDPSRVTSFVFPTPKVYSLSNCSEYAPARPRA